MVLVPSPSGCWSVARSIGREFREGGAAGRPCLEMLGAEPTHPELAEAPSSGSTRAGEAPGAGAALASPGGPRRWPERRPLDDEVLSTDTFLKRPRGG